MARYKGSEPKPVEFDFVEGKLSIRPMQSQEKWDIEARQAVDPDTRDFVRPGEYHAELIAASIVDETGKPAFTVSELRAMSVGHFNSLLRAVNDFHDAAKSKKN